MSYFFKVILIFLIALQFTVAVSAQSTEASRKYSTGKQLYAQKKFALAKQAFKEVGLQGESPYRAYAYFFYAKSAQQLGNIEEAKNMALQLLRKNSVWSKRQSVYLLLGELYFELGEDLNALNYLNKITDAKILTDAAKVKRFHLSKNIDLDQLAEFYNLHNKDSVLAKIVLSKTIQLPFHPQSNQLRTFILSEHPDWTNDSDNYAIIKKEEYEVAVLLPFYIDDITESSQLIGRDLVLDMYQGMKLAVKNLKRQGINIALKMYDSKKDSTVVRSLIEKGVFKNTDVIVGPLNKDLIKIVANYAALKNIPIINPISSNGNYLKDFQNILLTQPTLESMAKSASTNIKLNSKESTRFLVIKGESMKDSLFAEAFVNTFDQDSLLNIYGNEKVKPGDYNYIKTLFFTEIEEPNQEKEIILKDFDGVFVASENKLLIANVISAAEMRGDTLKIFGTENWIYKYLAGHNQMERLGVQLLNPHYIDYQSADVLAFKNQYMKYTGLIPNRQTFVGYDNLMLIGNLLNEYGINFLFHLDEAGEIPSTIFKGGYQFDLERNNKIVPIVQMSDGEIILKNLK